MYIYICTYYCCLFLFYFVFPLFFLCSALKNAIEWTPPVPLTGNILSVTSCSCSLQLQGLMFPGRRNRLLCSVEHTVLWLIGLNKQPCLFFFFFCLGKSTHTSIIRASICIASHCGFYIILRAADILSVLDVHARRGRHCWHSWNTGLIPVRFTLMNLPVPRHAVIAARFCRGGRIQKHWTETCAFCLLIIRTQSTGQLTTARVWCVPRCSGKSLASSCWPSSSVWLFWDWLLVIFSLFCRLIVLVFSRFIPNVISFLYVANSKYRLD